MRWKTGDTINGWELTKETDYRLYNSIVYEVKCTECGISGLRGAGQLDSIMVCNHKSFPYKKSSLLTKKQELITDVWKSHGLTSHKFYSVWQNMIHRCHNKKSFNYDKYGGRGITVCDEWRDNPTDYIDWLTTNSYRKGLNVDRIDNDKGYTPENCRVITPGQNMINRRKFGGNELLGVHKSRQFYYGTITHNGIEYKTNRHNIPESAAASRDFLAESLFGDIAVLNRTTNEEVQNIYNERFLRMEKR